MRLKGIAVALALAAAVHLHAADIITNDKEAQEVKADQMLAIGEALMGSRDGRDQVELARYLKTYGPACKLIADRYEVAAKEAGKATGLEAYTKEKAVRAKAEAWRALADDNVGRAVSAWRSVKK